MENCVRTVQSALLQSALQLGMPHVIQANSSLNQKFDIQATVAPADTDTFAMKYVAIGNGGHKLVTGVNGISTPEPIQHSPTDAALFNHLPFVLRLPNQDLTAAQRANYRLRRIESINGTSYVAYYLKVIDLSLTLPGLELRTVQNGIMTSTPYAPQLSDLSPTPPAISSGGVITTSGNFIAATSKVDFTLSADDITELLNVSNILYSSDSFALISEIGLCSGVDRAVTGDFNGTSAGYTEVIGAQVMNFIDSFFPAKFNNNGLSLSFDVGQLEPLMTLK